MIFLKITRNFGSEFTASYSALDDMGSSPVRFLNSGLTLGNCGTDSEPVSGLTRAPLYCCTLYNFVSLEIRNW